MKITCGLQSTGETVDLIAFLPQALTGTPATVLVMGLIGASAAEVGLETFLFGALQDGHSTFGTLEVPCRFDAHLGLEDVLLGLPVGSRPF